MVRDSWDKRIEFTENYQSSRFGHCIVKVKSVKQCLKHGLIFIRRNGDRVENRKTGQSKKEAILQTTLRLIAEEGFEAVTLRKIAGLAHVNVGLVNYYFGSKNKLLNEALRVILSSLKDAYGNLEREELAPKERLKRFLIQYVSVYQAYPSIPSLFLKKSTYEFDSRRDYVNFLDNLGLKKIVQIIREITGGRDEKTCRVILSQLLGAIFMPMIILPAVKETTSFRLPEPEKHIQLLLDHYFYRYG